MKFRELTEEQMNKICDYIEERDWQFDEQRRLINFKRCCMNCPFSTYTGEFDTYDCAKPALDRELPEEFEKLIKEIN